MKKQAITSPMWMNKPLSAACLLLGAVACAPIALANDAYPSKPVTLVVPNPPGGVVDTSARILSESLAKVMGQAVIVDNKPGGSGAIAYSYVAKAPKDGYTLLISYSAYHVANPSIFAKLPWDQKDFTPVSLITTATNLITVHPSVPAKNLKDFIAYAKANPGKLNYASQGNGSLSHLGTELFKQQTGTQMQHVPYKGSGEAIKDVLAGEVQVFITTPPSVMQHVNSGKLKALATTSQTRQVGAENVPTVTEAGLKGFELEAWVGLFAPAGTPSDVVIKLSNDVKKALEQPEAVARAKAAGVNLSYLPPPALAKKVYEETAMWKKIIQAADIRAE